MISILVLDDDSEKVARIKEVVASVPNVDANLISVATDLISARDITRISYFDLLILDIRIPNRAGDDPLTLGGCEFVKELVASDTLRRPYHILGLSAYDELVGQADPTFGEFAWRIIHYDSARGDWARILKSSVQYLVESKRTLAQLNPTQHGVDLAIVTALRDPELQSVLDLSGDWSQVQEPEGPTIYYAGAFRRDERVLRVVAATAAQMGMPAATLLSTKIIQRYRPRYIAITGIAAGIASAKVRVGDLLVAEQSWDYGSGKWRTLDGEDSFEPDPRPIPCDVNLRSMYVDLAARGAYVDDIRRGWRGPKPDVDLRVVVGPIGSGSAVVQSPQVTGMLQEQSRKVVGLDMETYGVFFAAANAPHPRPTAMCIKGVSDLADEHKSDEFQAYASYCSARYLYSIATEHFLPTRISG